MFCRLLYSILTRLRHYVSLAAHSIGGKYISPKPWDTDRPLISVIIPCYNHGLYLAEAVDSVLAQTWQNMEIIVVDDGSSDGETRSILERFVRPKTRIIHHSENLGLPAARNTGIRQAKGKYICCLDADDKLHPTYLEKAMLLMEANPGVSIFYSWVQVFGDEDRVWYSPQFDPAQLIFSNQIIAPAVFRRKDWEDVGGYREEMNLGYEDWEFWVRLARRGYRGYRIPEKMLLVRRVGRSFVHAAMEKHDQLVDDMRRYNPDVYDNTLWVRDVKRSYRDTYARSPLSNMQSLGDYLTWRNPKIWHVWETSACLKDKIPVLRREIQEHPGESIIVSYNVLEESILDELYTYTPYIYTLPHFLPRHAWKAFGEIMLRRAGHTPP